MPKARSNLAHRPAPAARLQARKQELVRNAIWDAAIDLFAERGFDETTIEEIAAAAGVSERSFFRYFASKADLLGSGLDQFCRSVSSAIDACPPDAAPARLLREAVLGVARQAALYPRTHKIIQISLKYPAARQAQNARLSEAQAAVMKAYARRLKSGRKGDILPRLLTTLTMSLFDLALTTWLATGSRDMDATVDEIFRSAHHLLTPVE